MIQRDTIQKIVSATQYSDIQKVESPDAIKILIIEATNWR